MKTLIQSVGQILRFPFYCVGVLLWVLLGVPIAFINCVCQIAYIPLAFVQAAWRNDHEHFEKCLKAPFDFSPFVEALYNLNDWLKNG